MTTQPSPRSLDYTKRDTLVEQYRRAADKAAFLDQVWGDLTSRESAAFFAAIDSDDVTGDKP